MLFLFKSTRLKIIPVLGSAGKIFNFAKTPVCMPIPSIDIFLIKFFELILTLTTYIKMLKIYIYN